MQLRTTVKDFLVSFRNYCFTETRNSRDEHYAEGAHLLMFMAVIFIYLCALPASLLMIVLKISPVTLAYVKRYPILQLLFAVINLLVLGRLVLIFTRKITAVPIDRNWNNEKLNQLRPIYIGFMLLSLLCMFGTLYLTNKILSIFDI